MTDKQINTCEFFDICEAACGGTLEDTEMCHCYELYKHIARKEQECEDLKEKIENYCFDCDVAERMRKVTYAVTGGRLSYANYTVEAIEQAYDDQLRIDVEYRTKELEEQLDQLKAEVKSKTEYIQEQREIIDRYSKEIEMYKKCQGKRASKREEELKAENKGLIRRITKIFACLIKANRTNKIVDTLWVDNITTLWDYIAQTLGIEGDQVQIEEQILQKISECEVTND